MFLNETSHAIATIEGVVATANELCGAYGEHSELCLVPAKLEDRLRAPPSEMFVAVHNGTVLGLGYMPSLEQQQQ